MDEYISKQSVLDYLNGYLHSLGEGGADAPLFDCGQRRALINAIQDISCGAKVADVQPVRHGRWKLTDNPSFKKCSECDAWWSSVFTDSCLIKYCPNCGARMMKDGDAE